MTTLLDMTQEVLAEMSGDEVNSIFDTEEAEQVARIIVSTYKAMMARDKWPHARKGTQLTARSDVLFPTHFSLPSDVQEVESIRYDKKKQGETRRKFLKVDYCDPDDFLKRLNSRDSTHTTTQVVTNDDGIELLIRNDKAPDWFTSFNDKDLVFDSFDSTVDATLQESKMQAIVYVMLSLPLVDASVIDIPIDAEPGLYEEALARAQFKIKEFQDIKAEQEATRQRRSISQKRWRANDQTRYPDYGRKR